MGVALRSAIPLLGLIALFLIFHESSPQHDYVDIVVVYRGTWLVVLYAFLCGVNIYVWEKFNINYLQAFDIDLKHISYYLEFFEAAATLAFIWSLGIILYLWVSKTGAHFFGVGFAPLVLSFIFWAVILCPGNIFYKSTRHWIYNHFLSFFIGPFAVVNFASCWVADQFTSTTVALVDFEYTACHYFYYIGNVNCTSFHKIMQPICVSFPYIWRFMQCMRQHYDTKKTNHLLNAGKYATSLVAIFFSTVHLFTQDDPNEWSIYRSYWVVTIIMSTVYSYVWDIVMDWGLMKKNPNTGKFFFLRDVLVYERPMVYYFAMVTNLLMRTTWTITLNPEYFGIHFRRDILVFFLSSVELLRRIQWNFFRMEYEHVNNYISKSGNKSPSPSTSTSISTALSKHGHDPKYQEISRGHLIQT